METKTFKKKINIFNTVKDKKEFIVEAMNLVRYANDFLGYDIREKKRFLRYTYTRYVIANYLLSKYRELEFYDINKGFSIVGKILNKRHGTIINGEREHNQLIKDSNEKYLFYKRIVDSIINLYNNN